MFTLTGIPNGSTIIWDAVISANVVTIDDGKSAKITWESESAPTEAFVTVQVNNTNSTIGNHTLSLSVHVKGIPSNCSIFGANTVRKCCTNSLTYSLQNFGDGDMFTWTVNGWTLNSGQGTSSINVIPSAQGTATISCVVRVSTAPSSYFRNPSKSIARSDVETPSKVVNSFPQGQPSHLQDRACRGQAYTFSANPICGATLTWSFPQSWGVTNRTGTTVNFTVGNIAQDGNIGITATFAGGCTSTTQNFPIDVITTAPIAPVISHNDSYLYYHCGQWRFPGYTVNGTVSGSVSFNGIPPVTQQLVFTVTSPWYFDGGGTTRTVTVDTPTPWWSPTIKCPSGAAPGTFKLKAVNCAGSSAWAQTTIYREPYTYWYTHTYPEWCECCEVLCDGCPPYPLKTDVETATTQALQILPNPCQESTTLHLPMHDDDGYEVTIYDIQGKPVKQMHVFQAMTDIDISTLSSGIYHVVAKGNSESFTQKMLITK